MRTTIVPSQITTIEDKVAANLGLSQVLLLITPVFGGSGIFVILPPFFNYATYKIVLIAAVALVCGMLAVRIKGRIVLLWALAILRFNLRPMYYVFDKNSVCSRDLNTSAPSEEPAVTEKPPVMERQPLVQLSPAELVKIGDVIADPAVHLHFTTNKKGELRVHLNEVAHESLGSSAN